MIEDLVGLSDVGISGSLLLQWVNDGSVKVIIKNATARISSICDLSGEEYDRLIDVKNFDARFSSDIDSEDQDRVYDELFPMDPQWETITIYDLLVQSIRLQEPIVFIKPGKEYLFDEYDEDDGDYTDEDTSQGNVLFR
jgi:hypothetical protein